MTDEIQTTTTNSIEVLRAFQQQHARRCGGRTLTDHMSISPDAQTYYVRCEAGCGFSSRRRHYNDGRPAQYQIDHPWRSEVSV